MYPIEINSSTLSYVNYKFGVLLFYLGGMYLTETWSISEKRI